MQQHTEKQKELLAAAAEHFGAETLAAHQKQYPGLAVACVGGKFGLFKKPDRKVISAATAYAVSDPIRYIEILAGSCWVDGDRELLDDDDYFISMMPVIHDLIQTKEADLVKL